jgi:hypothetical protein
MKIKKTYSVNIEASDKSPLPIEGDVRVILERGLQGLEDRSVTVSESSEDKDGRIVELEEHLHALLNYCMEDCRKMKVTKAFWQAVYKARECMNKSYWEHLHMGKMPSLNNGDYTED